MSESTYVEMLDTIVDGYYGDSFYYYKIRDLCKAADAAISGGEKPIPHGAKVHMEQFDQVESDHTHNIDTWEGEGGA